MSAQLARGEVPIGDPVFVDLNTFMKMIDASDADIATIFQWTQAERIRLIAQNR